MAEFVVGASNEYAFRAAELTARGRQQASPRACFAGRRASARRICCGRLLREYRRHHPRATAVYLTAEQFTTGFVEAIRGSGLPSFRQKCRGAKLLGDRRPAILRGKRADARRIAAHDRHTVARDGRSCLASDRGLAELRVAWPGTDFAIVGRADLRDRVAGVRDARLDIVRRLCDEVGLCLRRRRAVARGNADHGRAPASCAGAASPAGDEPTRMNEPITRDMAERGACRPGPTQHADRAAGGRAEGRVRRVRRRAGAVAVGSQRAIAQRAADAGDVAGPEVHAGAAGARSASSSAAAATAR